MKCKNLFTVKKAKTKVTLNKTTKVHFRFCLACFHLFAGHGEKIKFRHPIATLHKKFLCLGHAFLIINRSLLLGASICAVPLSQPIPVKKYF